MKVIFSGGVLVFVAVVGWRMGGVLSPDALGMAVGLLFGVMAGIPTALILLAGQRREGELRGGRPYAAKCVSVVEPRGQIAEVHHHYHVNVVGDGEISTQEAQISIARHVRAINRLSENSQHTDFETPGKRNLKS